MRVFVTPTYGSLTSRYIWPLASPLLENICRSDITCPRTNLRNLEIDSLPRNHLTSNMEPTIMSSAGLNFDVNYRVRVELEMCANLNLMSSFINLIV